jgi:hypothetical protein
MSPSNLSLSPNDTAFYLNHLSSCKDREDFAVFPPFQTERAPCNALRFPVGPVDFGRADSSSPTERRTSHQGPSSAFPSASVGFPFDRLTLTDLHHVLVITTKPWATTPPPPSVPRARIFAPHCWAKPARSSPVPIDDVRAIRRCPLYAGCTVESSWSGPKPGQAGIVPFWVGRVSQLRPSMFTTLQTGVPFVSIDREGSARSPFWLGDRTHCQQASHPRWGYDLTPAAYPSHHDSCAALNEQHHLSLKGALRGTL